MHRLVVHHRQPRHKCRQISAGDAGDTTAGLAHRVSLPGDRAREKRIHALQKSVAVAELVREMCIRDSLWVIYNKGGIHLNGWFFMANPRLYFDEATNILRGSTPFDYRAPVWFGVGTAFTFFLYAMRDVYKRQGLDQHRSAGLFRST